MFSETVYGKTFLFFQMLMYIKWWFQIGVAAKWWPLFNFIFIPIYFVSAVHIAANISVENGMTCQYIWENITLIMLFDAKLRTWMIDCQWSVSSCSKWWISFETTFNSLSCVVWTAWVGSWVKMVVKKFLYYYYYSYFISTWKLKFYQSLRISEIVES